MSITRAQISRVLAGEPTSLRTEVSRTKPTEAGQMGPHRIGQGRRDLKESEEGEGPASKLLRVLLLPDHHGQDCIEPRDHDDHAEGVQLSAKRGVNRRARRTGAMRAPGRERPSCIWLENCDWHPSLVAWTLKAPAFYLLPPHAQDCCLAISSVFLLRHTMGRTAPERDLARVMSDVMRLYERRQIRKKSAGTKA